MRRFPPDRLLRPPYWWSSFAPLVAKVDTEPNISNCDSFHYRACWNVRRSGIAGMFCGCRGEVFRCRAFGLGLLGDLGGHPGGGRAGETAPCRVRRLGVARLGARFCFRTGRRSSRDCRHVCWCFSFCGVFPAGSGGCGLRRGAVFLSRSARVASTGAAQPVL
jgi:hypothetical protein